MHKRVIVFASGSPTGGGSGFQELVENAATGVLNAQIAGVVSQYPDGGVKKKADALGIPFIHFPKGGGEVDYRRIVDDVGAEFVLLSGWVLRVKGLDPCTTINIHPGPVKFGGKGMYGHHVHEAVMRAYHAGQLAASEVSMHFVTDEYDQGPVFFRYPVLIRPDDTPKTLADRVNKIEHGWQSWVTDLVVRGDISWDGRSPSSFVTPDWYRFDL